MKHNAELHSTVRGNSEKLCGEGQVFSQKGMRRRQAGGVLEGSQTLWASLPWESFLNLFDRDSVTYETHPSNISTESDLRLNLNALGINHDWALAKCYSVSTVIQPSPSKFMFDPQFLK